MNITRGLLIGGEHVAFPHSTCDAQVLTRATSMVPANFDDMTAIERRQCSAGGEINTDEISEEPERGHADKTRVPDLPRSNHAGTTLNVNLAHVGEKKRGISRTKHMMCRSVRLDEAGTQGKASCFCVSVMHIPFIAAGMLR